MKKIKTMIVDDSSFSSTLIKGMLDKKGLEVVAQAETVKDAIEKAKQLKPDFITMDITLPDGNGIDCSEAILKENPKCIIVAISSMMDEELMKKGTNVGIKAFIQKPVEEKEVFALIEKMFQGEELYEILENNYREAFKESFLTNVMRNIDPGASYTNINNEDYKVIRKVSGFSVTIGIIGRHLGRMMMDWPEDSALKIARKIYGKEEVSSKEIVAFFNEFANVIAGNASSMLNSLNRGLGLRVSPPTVFHGHDLMISTGDMTSESFSITTVYGDIFLNVGIGRGDDQWM